MTKKPTLSNPQHASIPDHDTEPGPATVLAVSAMLAGSYQRRCCLYTQPCTASGP